MFENASVEEIMEMAGQVGRSVAREFPGLEAEDITSEALIAVMENTDLYWRDAGYIATAMEGYAVKYALRERYDYMVATSSYVYRPAEVRALLSEVFWSPDDWDVPSAKDDQLSDGISNGTLFVSVLDLQEAWKKISPSHADTLTRVFRDGEEPNYRMDVTRAVDALTRALNWRVNRSAEDHEGPGARKAMSNSEAQYLTRNQ